MEAPEQITVLARLRRVLDVPADMGVAERAEQVMAEQAALRQWATEAMLTMERNCVVARRPESESPNGCVTCNAFRTRLAGIVPHA